MFKRKSKNQPRRSSPEGQSANPYSYYTSRSRVDSPVGRGQDPEAKTRSTKWWYHIPSFVALAAIIISALYVLSLSVSPKVVLISDKDGQYILRDIAVYQKAAKSLMTKSLFNRTKFTIDTISLAKELKKQFPELDEVAVTIPLAGRRPIFELSSARPALIFLTVEDSYIVDSRGRAVVKTSDVPKRSNLAVPIVKDKSGLAVSLGEVAMPSDTVKFIGLIEGQLRAKSLSISSIELPAVANELHVRIDGQPYFIKFNLEGNAREQVGAFLAAKQKFETDHTIPAEYVDARIDERIYYR